MTGRRWCLRSAACSSMWRSRMWTSDEMLVSGWFGVVPIFVRSSGVPIFVRSSGVPVNARLKYECRLVSTAHGQSLIFCRCPTDKADDQGSTPLTSRNQPSVWSLQRGSLSSYWWRIFADGPGSSWTVVDVRIHGLFGSSGLSNLCILFDTGSVYVVRFGFINERIWTQYSITIVIFNSATDLGPGYEKIPRHPRSFCSWICTPSWLKGTHQPSFKNSKLTINLYILISHGPHVFFIMSYITKSIEHHSRLSMIIFFRNFWLVVILLLYMLQFPVKDILSTVPRTEP